MNRRPSHERPLKTRQPLADATNWVNAHTSTPSPDSVSSTPLKIPHHESLLLGGNLKIREPLFSPPSVAEDKRLSAITNESQRNSNRDSKISAASTNASGKSKRKTHVGPWQLGITLGKGASGRVRKARHAVTGQDAAIKIVSKLVAKSLRTKSLANMDTMIRLDPSAPEERRQIPFGIEREVVILKLIEHPHIISLYDVWENRGELWVKTTCEGRTELTKIQVSSTRVCRRRGVVSLHRRQGPSFGAGSGAHFSPNDFGSVILSSSQYLPSGSETRKHPHGWQQKYQDCGLWNGRAPTGKQVAEHSMRKPTLCVARGDHGPELSRG